MCPQASAFKEMSNIWMVLTLGHWWHIVTKGDHKVPVFSSVGQYMVLPKMYAFLSFTDFPEAQSSQGNSSLVSSLPTCYETLLVRRNIHLFVLDKVLITDKQTINIKVPQMPSSVSQYIY